MIKEDLKTGMLVEMNDGSIMMVINDQLVSQKEHNPLCNYNRNMKGNYDFIIKISMILDEYYLRPEYWTKETLNKYLLWEREFKETIKIGDYTYDKNEVEEKLKNLKPIEQ